MTLTERPTGVEAPLAEPQRPTWASEALLLPAATRMVHIGPHKTGTTAIQAALFAARAELERQGVTYASEGRHAMTSVLAGLQLPDAWADERRPPPRWKWERLLRKVRTSTAERVILSSEFFADGRPEMVRKVIEELDPERVHVVVTLRPLARIIPSQWQQWIQNLWTTPLDRWVRDLIEKPDGGAGTIFWWRHRHDQLIRRWAEIVGPDRVTAVALDEQDHGMVLRVFEALVGLREGTLEPVDALSNRSMTMPEIEVVRAFNALYKAEKLPRRLYTRVMRFGAASFMESRPPAPGESRIELPGWAAEPIAAIAREVIEGIRASGVRVIGNLEPLADVPVPHDGEIRDGTPGVVTVTPEVAASAAMGVLIASGLARGTGSTRANGGDVGGSRLRLQAPPAVQEPPELMRLSTTQLVIVLVRRARAEVFDRLARLAFWRR